MNSANNYVVGRVERIGRENGWYRTKTSSVTVVNGVCKDVVSIITKSGHILDIVEGENYDSFLTRIEEDLNSGSRRLARVFYDLCAA